MSEHVQGGGAESVAPWWERVARGLLVAPVLVGSVLVGGLAGAICASAIHNMTITSGAGTCDDCSIAAYGLINGLLIPATLVIGTIATIVVARRTRSRQRATEAAAIVGVLLFLANVALATLARVLEALGVN